MTDKSIMVQRWRTIVKELRNAEADLDIAEDILRRTFVINNSGYQANEIEGVSDNLHDFRDLINDRVIPAIKKI